MEFNLTEEQQMLADAIRRWLSSNYDFDVRRRLAATPSGFSEDNWRQLAELGVLGLNVPLEYGGLGAGAAETLLVMQDFGRALLTEPYLPTAIMAVEALKSAGNAGQQARFLPRIASGDVRFALALFEPELRYELTAIETTVTRLDDGGSATYLLHGRKAVVLQGGAAHQLLVSARLRDSDGGQTGLALFLVDAAAAGVQLQSFPTIDGLRSAEIGFEAVRLSADALLGTTQGGATLIERVVERGVAALCAEAVGAIERLIELTVEHLKTRRQFGQPIAAFQVLQHRLADMLTAAEQARSMALMAAAQVDNPDDAERSRAISAAKTMIGQSGRFVGEQAVQLHGGMGMTDELAVGHYFKRLVAIDLSFGDSQQHLRRFGEQL